MVLKNKIHYLKTVKSKPKMYAKEILYDKKMKQILQLPKKRGN